MHIGAAPSRRAPRWAPSIGQGGRERANLPDYICLVGQEHEQIGIRYFDNARTRDAGEKVLLPAVEHDATCRDGQLHGFAFTVGLWREVPQ